MSDRKGETMKLKPLAALIAVLCSLGHSYEGTPQQGILYGEVFIGTVKASDKDAKPDNETITGGMAQIRSAWAEKLGFGALKWTSIGEISGDAHSSTLEISVEAANEARDRLQINVVVNDLTSLSAVAKLMRADGSATIYQIDATLQPWVKTDAYKNAHKDIEDADLAVEQAPARYIAPDVEVEKKLGRHISFKVNARPLDRCLESLASQIKVPMVCDFQWDHQPLVTIDAYVKPIREIIDDLTKQANVEYVVRGRAVLVTKAERAAKLRLMPKKDVENGKQ